MDGTRFENVHGTAISVAGKGALLRGPSGAGKSDLALRVLALEAGGMVPERPVLVADDRVDVAVKGGMIAMSCPKTLEGLLEVRGLGIVQRPFVPAATLWLVVDLVKPSEIERMPEPGRQALVCGCPVSAIALTPFEASSPLKLVLALEAAARDQLSDQAR
jgi:HPr kinase/phosphorylase